MTNSIKNNNQVSIVNLTVIIIIIILLGGIGYLIYRIVKKKEKNYVYKDE